MAPLALPSIAPTPPRTVIMRLLPLCLLLLINQADAEIRLQDDLGRMIVLDAPARQVISLVPHATEMLFEIGAAEHLVATVRHADYPAAASAVPRVGDYSAINSEAILRRQPDLIIAYPDAPYRAQVNRLTELGLTVFYSDPQDFDAIARSLQDFGRLTGEEEGARRSAEAFAQGLAELTERYAQSSELSLFYEVWHEPIYTLNGESYISDVIRLCGARNVFADLPVLSPQLSLEAVFDADPAIIVTGDTSPWLDWEQLQAVANDALITLDSDSLSRPTPGLLNGATELCRAIDRVRQRRLEQ